MRPKVKFLNVGLPKSSEKEKKNSPEI